MTENEAKAVKFIQNIKDDAIVTLDHIAKEEPNVSPLVYKSRKEKASTILAMVGELLQYRAIGTVEECRVAVEKQKAIEPIKINDSNFEYQCPKCHFKLEIGYKHCISCGQLLKYSNEK